MKRFWLLALLGCTSQEKREMADSVRVEILSVTPENPMEGETVEIRYRIVNATADVVLLGGGRSQYGGIREVDGDKVLYNELVQSATPPVFYSSTQLLLPRASREETARVEVFEPVLRFSTGIVRHDVALLRLYAPMQGAGTDREYRRMAPEKLEAKEFIVLGEGKEEAPFAERRISIQPRPFALAEATKKFGESPANRRWSKVLGGWILASKSRTAIVKSDELRELPAGAFSVVTEYEHDVSKFQFRLVDPSKTELARMFQTREGDGMYTHGTFIDIPREKLFEALELARAERLGIEQVFYFFGSYYFEFRPTP